MKNPTAEEILTDIGLSEQNLAIENRAKFAGKALRTLFSSALIAATALTASAKEQSYGNSERNPAIASNLLPNYNFDGQAQEKFLQATNLGDGSKLDPFYKEHSSGNLFVGSISGYQKDGLFLGISRHPGNPLDQATAYGTLDKQGEPEIIALYKDGKLSQITFNKELARNSDYPVPETINFDKDGRIQSARYSNVNVNASSGNLNLEFSGSEETTSVNWRDNVNHVQGSELPKLGPNIAVNSVQIAGRMGKILKENGMGSVVADINQNPKSVDEILAGLQNNSLSSSISKAAESPRTVMSMPAPQQQSGNSISAEKEL